MTTTARDLITGALRLIQVIGAGETPSAEDANDCLSALNEMIDSWSLEKDTIFEETDENFPLVAGTASYTMGPSGTFNTARPVSITSAFLREGTIDHPLEILDGAQYDRIPAKSETFRPERFYFNGGFPRATISFESLPTAGLTFFAKSLKPLTQIATLDTALSLPPGYLRAFKFNLAIERAPEYERPVSDDVRRIAAQSKGAIMDANTMNENNQARVDDALVYIGGCSSFYR